MTTKSQLLIDVLEVELEAIEGGTDRIRHALWAALSEVKAHASRRSVHRQRTPQPDEGRVNVEKLSDEDLELCEIECISIGGERGDRIRAVLREFQKLRVAKAAARERVRDVVFAEASKLGKVCVCMTDARLLLASRVADALAVPGRLILSDQELSQLRELRSECVVDDYPAAAPALDRILSARPIPLMVRDIVQREFERVPAGEQHDWERQRLQECLEVLP